MITHRMCKYCHSAAACAYDDYMLKPDSYGKISDTNKYVLYPRSELRNE